MTETREVSIEDVRTLVGERQRYDDWLSALEGRRAETPARVFERVHGDYAARRAAVMEQLRAHVGTLAALADDLDSKLGALDESLASLEDERVEAMLRTAVGEFDDDRWEQVRRDVEAKIAERTTERSALTVEADDVRTLLSSARSEPLPTPPAVAVAEVAETPKSDDVALAERVTDADVTPIESVALETTEVQGSAIESDTLDIEDALAMFTPSTQSAAAPTIDTTGIEVIGHEVSGTTGRQDTMHTPPAAPAAVPPAAHADADPFDDLAFLRSVIDPSEAARGSQQAGGTAAATAAEPQKTLRCTECGTMNLPTEWYCERCGGELAAF